jgi:hypothetical protein
MPTRTKYEDNPISEVVIIPNGGYGVFINKLAWLEVNTKTNPYAEIFI